MDPLSPVGGPEQTPEAQHALGTKLLVEGRAAEALAPLKAALEAAPSVGQHWVSFVEALIAAGQLLAAEQVLAQGRGLGLAGEVVEALAARAAAGRVPAGEVEAFSRLFAAGRYAEAEAAARGLAERFPLDPFAWKALGAASCELRRYPDAIAAEARALAYAPGDPELHHNLALAERGLMLYPEAAEACRRALALAPGFAGAEATLGSALAHLGRFEEAEAAYGRALALAPGLAEAESGRLFMLNYAPEKSAEEVFAAYRRFGDARRRPAFVHANDRDPERRLKLGYVSGDFYSHPVRHFLEPLLARHDRDRFEVHLYSDGTVRDAVTDRYRGYADRWTDIRSLSDQALAERIRADGIDVLNDLAGHTRDNRLGAFAYRPAPVSLTWLGYACTTGLEAIDYYLTDAVVAPPGAEALFSETPWRLDRPGYVFRPDPGMGEPAPLPALAAGHVTFGSLSRSIRINDRMVRTWAALLERVPGSRLVLDAAGFQHPSMQAVMAERFARHGVARERLEFGYASPAAEALARIDVALDCFPHNSGTTLFEGLHMGVPFVTLAGRPGVGRLGASILTGLGRPEWIAEDEAAYVDAAAALAADLPALAGLRAGLRAEMRDSPLMDEEGFARAAEAAFRAMWRRWAEGGQPPMA